MAAHSLRLPMLAPILLALAAVAGFRAVPDSWREAVFGPPPLRPRECVALEWRGGWVVAVAFSPDGSRVAAGGHFGESRGEFRVWEVPSGRPVYDRSLDPEAVFSLAFSPDGRTLATGGSGATVRFWDAATGRPDGVLRGKGARVGRVAFAAGGRLTAFADAPAADDEYAPGPVGGVRWCLGGGSTAASADCGVTARADPESWAVFVRRSPTAPACELPRPRREVVLAMDCAADGRRLAIGCHDGTVESWDATGLVPTARERLHDGAVNAVMFSPDGRVLATASNDRTVGLWDAATLEPLAVLTGPSAAVYCVAFSPDGRRVAAGGFDRTVRVWDVPQLARRSP